MILVVGGSVYLSNRDKNFPATVKPIVWLLNYNTMKRQRATKEAMYDNKREARQLGLDIDTSSREKYYDSLFNSDGSRKYEENGYDKLYTDYQRYYAKLLEQGYKGEDREMEALRHIKSSNSVTDDDGIYRARTAKGTKRRKIRNKD